MKYTLKLAQYATSLKFEDLPGDVIEKVKTLVLDNLGIALFVSTKPWGKIIFEFVNNLGGRQQSTVIGYGLKTSACNAALANGTMAHGFEFDDTHYLGKLHPGSVVIPPALALGEREHASGRDFITAIVAGYEVGLRIGKASGETFSLRGFHTQGCNGTFAAAASAGLILDLDEEQMAYALGLAGMQSAGLYVGAQKSMAKRFFSGRAAESGVASAILAKMGFTGPNDVLEHDCGYFKAYSDDADLDKLIEQLGRTFEIRNTALKAYPCAITGNSIIEAVLRILEGQKFAPEDVREVVIGTSKYALHIITRYEISDVMAAQFSFPYCAAVALVYGDVTVSQFTEQSINNERVLEIARKVKLVFDEEMDRLSGPTAPAKVSIELKDGTKHTAVVRYPKGFPQSPMNRREVLDKFKSLASKVIGNEDLAGIVKTINELDELDDLNQLTRMLYPKK